MLGAAVAWATGGVGAKLLANAGVTTTATTSAMANAAFTSLASQASILLVNNKGNIGKTLKDLGKSSVIKSMLSSVITAGVMDKLGNTQLMKDLQGKTAFSDKLTYNLINATGRAVTNAALNGGSLEDSLKSGLVGALVETAHGSVASSIKGLEGEYLAHKLAHALAGCVAGAASGGTCKDGAIGGAVGEMVAEMFKGQKPASSASDHEKQKYSDKVLAYSKLVAGTVSAYAGGDAKTAMNTAETAIKNNFLTDKQWNEFSKKLASCNLDKACEAAARREYLNLSKLQDAQLATCDARGDCDTLANNVTKGRTAMLQVIETGRLPDAYAGALDMQYMGQRLATDSGFRKQVGNAVEYLNWCSSNPSACTQDQIKKATGFSIIVLGPVIAANPQLVPAILFAQNGERMSSAAIGGGVNVLAQSLSNGTIKPEDVLKAAATAYATAGASISSTLAINVGTEGAFGLAKGDSTSDLVANMLLNAAGTAVGFKPGTFVKNSVETMVKPFNQFQSKSIGFLTIDGPYARSAIPSIFGNAASSTMGEFVSVTGQNLINSIKQAHTEK